VPLVDQLLGYLSPPPANATGIIVTTLIGCFTWMCDQAGRVLDAILEVLNEIIQGVDVIVLRLENTPKLLKFNWQILQPQAFVHQISRIFPLLVR
jgi:hypothetical protein